MDHVAVRLGHVLLERPTQRHVDDLRAPAHRQQRDAGVEGPSGHRQVEGVLLGVDVVDVLALGGLPVAGGVQVAAPGEQHRVGVGEPAADLVGVDLAAGRPRVDGERLATGAQHALGERAGLGERAVAVRRGGRGEPRGHDDERSGSHALTPHRVGNTFVSER